MFSDFLSITQRKDYVGIDISKSAIDLATFKRNGLTFIHVSAESYNPNKLFDVIVFNEILYYMNHRAIIKRFVDLLSPNGIIIVSCWFTKKIDGIMDGIFTDAELSLKLLDYVIISGYTYPKGLNRRVAVSFKIGAFKPMQNT